DLGDVLRVGDVELGHRQLRLRLLQLACLLVVQHRGNDLVPALRELDGRAAAETAGGAGDEHSLWHLPSYLYTTGASVFLSITTSTTAGRPLSSARLSAGS